MTRVALSKTQLKQINNFLDAELASIGDESSLIMGSAHTKTSFNNRYNNSPVNLVGQSLYTQPVQDFDRADILSTDNVL